jgi:hypothetical protein
MRALLVFVVAFHATFLIAQQPAENTPPPIESPAVPAPVSTPPPKAEEGKPEAAEEPEEYEPERIPVVEFKGEDMAKALRSLAHQAKVNLVVSNKAAEEGGTVTMRMEDQPAMRAIEVIVDTKGLFMNEANGVYFVMTKAEAPKPTIPQMLERLSEEIVGPLAQFKAGYYNELVAAGMAPEGAAQVVAQEEVSKVVFGTLPTERPREVRNTGLFEVSDLSSNEASNRSEAKYASSAKGSVFTLVFGILQALLNLALAIAVGIASNRIAGRGEPLTFFGPTLWIVATLVGGVFVAALYWLMHHSTLRRPAHT